jgi:RNA-directed DNA polymerase
MTRLIDLDADAAKDFFLKETSYFSTDLPSYFSFEPLLKSICEILGDRDFKSVKVSDPAQNQGVNYTLTTNKDGRFAWRPLELIHPVIYVSMVNVLCQSENWQLLKNRFAEFSKGLVSCCSIPVVPRKNESDGAAQVTAWWLEVEQQSIRYSLDYSHLLVTDVADCYGSLYTHSVPWALHGMDDAKTQRNSTALLGNKLDVHIRAGRAGQTNGIAQGSALMDFIAELVLGYGDHLISSDPRAKKLGDIKILRYRDDYRIFTKNDSDAEIILKIVSENLKKLGMRLAAQKTQIGTNIVSTSIKPDKIAAINLQDLGNSNAKTLQKRLLRIHAFGQSYPNSGALRRLVHDLYNEVKEEKSKYDDCEVLAAITCDIAVTSPGSIPAVAGILSHLISKLPKAEKISIWKRIRDRMKRLPNNAYLEIWLQRVTKPLAVGLDDDWGEPLCKVADSKEITLWNNIWISDKKLKEAIQVSSILKQDPASVPEAIEPEEIELFARNAPFSL